MTLLDQTSRRWTICLVVLGLVFKGLAPPGYMFAADLSGGWIAHLCPAGLPPGILQEGSHHHHHSAADSVAGMVAPASDLADHCPVGSLSSLAAISSDAWLSTILWITHRATTSSSVHWIVRSPHGYEARGPPHSP